MHFMDSFGIFLMEISLKMKSIKIVQLHLANICRNIHSKCTDDVEKLFKFLLPSKCFPQTLLFYITLQHSQMEHFVVACNCAIYIVASIPVYITVMTRLIFFFFVFCVFSPFAQKAKTFSPFHITIVYENCCCCSCCYIDIKSAAW